MKSQQARVAAADDRLPIAAAGRVEQSVLRLFRWVLSTTWILFLLVALLVAASLLASLYTGAWHWFQRSGALMVSIGAVLSTRGALSAILDGMIERPSRAPAAQPGDTSRHDELRTCLCGFLMVAVGTLVWAYGDLLGCLLDWSASCLG